MQVLRLRNVLISNKKKVKEAVPNWEVRDKNGEVDMQKVNVTIWRANAASRFAVAL